MSIAIPDPLNAGLDTPNSKLDACINHALLVIVVFMFLLFLFFCIQYAESLKMMTGNAAGCN